MKTYDLNDQHVTPEVQRCIQVKDLEEEANIQLRYHVFNYMETTGHIQEDVAMILGVAGSTLSRFLCGTDRNMEGIRRFSEMLDLDMNEYFDRYLEINKDYTNNVIKYIDRQKKKRGPNS